MVLSVVLGIVLGAALGIELGSSDESITGTQTGGRLDTVMVGINDGTAAFVGVELG